ncbi:MAG: HTH domain-containing protein, partial [Caldilinea sp.]
TGEIGGQIKKLGVQLAAMDEKLQVLEKEVEVLNQGIPVCSGYPESAPNVRRRLSIEDACRILLQRLQRASGKYVTSAELGVQAGISRATVAARIGDLKSQGHMISSSPRKGYLYVKQPF